ncbi:DNA adenine methylase [Microbacterium sp. GXF6406]
MGIIRYPGGKDRHLRFLRPLVHERATRSGAICEPFAGMAAVTLDVLKHGLVEHYWINDFDPSVAAFWTTVRDEPEALILAIGNYTPTVDDFYEFKSDPGTGTFERAFRKVVIQQVSYSGLGAKAGGPLGGRDQKSAYTVDCRWRPERLAKGIRTASALLNSVPGVISSDSFEDMLPPALDVGDTVYLDPPYVAAGPDLYVHGSINHEALASILRESANEDWVLSYDFAPEVQSMYSWADVEPVSVASGVANGKVTDALILPRVGVLV